MVQAFYSIPWSNSLPTLCGESVHLESEVGRRDLSWIFFFFFKFIITLGIHLQYSYTVLTYNRTTKFNYVTALPLTCLLLTYIKIPKTSLQQTKGLLKTINK